MQLVLDLKLKSDATFDNFILGQNELAVNALKAFAQGKGDSYCFVWSHPGDGLSHLLQAVCHSATQYALENMYLPLSELKVLGPDFLKGIESVPLVCIDDIDVLAGDKAWEEALFYAFNCIHEQGHRLLFGAHHVPAECGFQLKDLLSRISSGVAYPLLPLRDNDKVQLLQSMAKRRGFELSEEVIRYLLAHYPRDMKTQLGLFEKLNLVSLQERHKITVPFIKSKLAGSLLCQP